MSLKEAKGRRSRVLSFWVLKSIHASSRGGGNVEIAPHDLHFPIHSASDFQGLWEGRKTRTIVFRAFHKPPFPRPLAQPSVLRAQTQLLEQLRFRLLHAPRCIGVADGCGDAHTLAACRPRARAPECAVSPGSPADDLCPLGWIAGPLSVSWAS